MKRELKIELVRKAIHVLIALVPILAMLSRIGTLVLLAMGTALYVCLQTFRLRGIQVPVISAVTDFASRRRDRGRFVLGPVTLGAGAFFSLLLFPSVHAAIAIYALAAGDSVSSLAGKFFGRLRPAFLCGKSIEGSLACFTAVFLCSWAASGRTKTALIAAVAATITEALPLRNWDNIAIPLVTGTAVLFIAP